MLTYVGSVVANTTVPLQLIQAADAYDDAAARLSGVLAKLPPYLEQLDRAEQVNWDSMASVSFRSVLQALRIPGKLMSLELSALVTEATTIAANLRHYAQLAQNLISLLSSAEVSMPGLETAWDTAADRFELAWQEATSVLDGEAAVFVEFIDRHGGIPRIVEQAARELVRPW